MSSNCDNIEQCFNGKVCSCFLKAICRPIKICFCYRTKGSDVITFCSPSKSKVCFSKIAHTGRSWINEARRRSFAAISEYKSQSLTFA